MVALILKTTKITFFNCQFLKLINVCGSAVNKCGALRLGGRNVLLVSWVGELSTDSALLNDSPSKAVLFCLLLCKLLLF